MTDTTELLKVLRKVQERCFMAEDENWAHDILSIVVPVLDEASAMPQPTSTANNKLKEQVRPLGKNLSAFDVMKDAFKAQSIVAAMPQPAVEAGDALRKAREVLEKCRERLKFERDHDRDDSVCPLLSSIDAALAKLDTAEKGDGE